MTNDQLSLTFGALADPTRRAILARLATGERSVTELAEPFEMTLPAVTKHLKVLERAGLVSRGKRAQWRPCRLQPGPLREVASWVGEYRELWEARLDRLEDYLEELQGRNPAPRAPLPPKRAPKVPAKPLPKRAKQKRTGRH